MNNFFESELCKSETVCRKCRRAREYRRGVIAAFDEPTEVDFDCPKGKTTDDFPQGIEPSIFQMGKNLAKSMTREIKKRVTSKAPEVSAEEQARRLQTCADCEFFVDNKRCAKCGCYMGFKARLQTGQCPIGKW